MCQELSGGVAVGVSLLEPGGLKARGCRARQALREGGTRVRRRDALGVPATAGILADGETTIACVTETIGGGGANPACVAAALGVTVRFVGKTGADAPGTQLGLALRRRGVGARLPRDRRHLTGTTVALGFNTGQRHFLGALPNNRSLEFADPDLSALVGCDHLLRADVWFSPVMLEGGNRRWFAEARQRGSQPRPTSVLPRSGPTAAHPRGQRRQLNRDR